MKIKDRLLKKLNIISEKEDISGLKFSPITFEDLLKNADSTEMHDFVEFNCITKLGSLKFNAQKADNYKLNVVHAFAKVFDFESDVLLTQAQIERLQSFIFEFVQNGSFQKKNVADFKGSLFQKASFV